MIFAAFCADPLPGMRPMSPRNAEEDFSQKSAKNAKSRGYHVEPHVVRDSMRMFSDVIQVRGLVNRTMYEFPYR